LTEDLSQFWSGSSWVNGYKLSYTYDGNNNRTDELMQDWDDSTWVNVNKYIYSYLPTGIEQFEGEVSTYSLSNNYPNPFNPSTTISITIPVRSNVSLKVFNLLGSEVVELVKGEVEAGEYKVDFNTSNLPSGVYFYLLRAVDFVSTKKMILLK